MGKMIGLVLILAALYVGMTLYTEGPDAFGGAFSPIESNSDREPMATHLTAGAQVADEPADRDRGGVWITDHVRETAGAHMEEGARRRGY